MVNRTTITIHTRQRTVVRLLSGASLVRCKECRNEVLGVTPDSAADILEVSPPVVLTLLDGGTLHFASASFGPRLICANSLFNFSNQPHREV